MKDIKRSKQMQPVIPTLPWVELYIRKRKDILSIESRLSWDRYLDNESLKKYQWYSQTYILERLLHI